MSNSPFTTKEEWLDFWGYTENPESDHLWEQKCELDLRVYERTGKERNADIIPDISPYRSMIDGSIITSRSKHRTHLRDHGCIEVGNEIKAATTKPERKKVNWKENLIREIYQRRG